jgi:tetratricopeptide (TPR) repeat protein
MNELRLLFAKAADGAYTVRLDNNWGGGAGEPLPFEIFLTEDDHEDLRWYLEDFMDLPDGGSAVRARRVEQSIEDWGKRLFAAVFDQADNRELFNHLLELDPPRVLTIATRDPNPLRLPWEIMANKRGPLTRLGITIRRQLEIAGKPIQYKAGLPLRILLVISRPDDTGFIDPRMTTPSMLDALAPLGSDVDVDICRPPTLPRLEEMLSAAQSRGKPYHIFHFDGHGTFLPEIELGALCFEKAGNDGVAKIETDLVRADRLGNLLAAYDIPLALLEACRSGQAAKVYVFRSVAPRLIEAGVGSVVSMSHSVHVEAARILMARFYRELVECQTIGQALEAGRGALLVQPHRWIERGPGGKTVALTDWFLPHLYQRGEDLRLVPERPPRPAVPVPSETTYQYDAFLSYSHADERRVKELFKLLTEDQGLTVFLDESQIGAGPLHEQCAQGIDQSRFLLLACSEKSLASDWVMAEHDIARARDPRGRHIIPLMLEQVSLPSSLQALNWQDLTNPAQDKESVANVAHMIRATGSVRADEDKQPSQGKPLSGNEPGAFPPAPIHRFHGRARELHRLERQFRTHRAILLHAMGGMGKTSLAREAAFWWTRTGLFPDGACFISFEQFAGADRVVQVLGTYLEGAAFESLPVEQQYERARELFNERDVLVVWDNFERVLPAFQSGDGARLYSDAEHNRILSLFRTWTSEPGGKGRLLVTCRPEEAGLAGALRHELHGLARPDSLHLLARVLQTNGVDLDDPRLGRDKLDELLHMLDDHPLSIELVGPHLKKLTPEKVVEDFGRLLEEFKRGQGEERNESLLASLAFSTRRLSGEAQKILPWLGLFRGGVFEQILLSVTEIETDQWDQSRTELEATALVRIEDDFLLVDRPYLRFHPTLTYTAAPGTELLGDEARRRFIAVYHSLNAAIHKGLTGSDPGGAMEIMAREERNVRSAVTWALAQQAYTTASVLGGTFAIYLQMSGCLREHDAWVAWLAREVGKGGFTRGAAAREEDAAWSLFTQGRAQEAIEKLQALIEQLRSTSDFDPAFELAAAQGALGRIYHVGGHSSQAIPILEEAVRTWETLTNKAQAQGEDTETRRGNLAGALGDLANALRNSGQLDKALEVSKRGLAIHWGLNAHREVAVGLARGAHILTEQGRFQEADVHYEQALQAIRSARDKALEGLLLQHQGALAVDMGQYARAAELLARALNLFQEMNDQASVMLTCNLLGAAEQGCGRLAEARAWYERCRQIARDRQDNGSLADAAHSIGCVCHLEGEGARASGDEALARERLGDSVSFVSEALRIRRQQKDRPREAQSRSQLAEIHLVLGEFDQAERHAHQAREIREELRLKEVCRDYHTLGQIARARGNTAEVTEWQAKRDTVLAEWERRAQGPRGFDAPFARAIQGLAVACARAGFGGDEPVDLEPQAEVALAQIAKLPSPMPAVAGALRAVATGKIPTIGDDLPAELRELLTQLIAAIKEST